MAKRRRIRWDRIIMVFGPIFLLIILLAVKCSGGDKEPEPDQQPAETTVTTYTDVSADPAAAVMELPESEPAEPDYPEMGDDEIVIVIDPGHGGEDGGAVQKDEDDEVKRKEKDDNLRLALAVRDSFEKYDDVRVIMTRETDVFVELEDRCTIANQANADFFISLHRNSSLTGSGIEVWINNTVAGDNSWDKLLAEYILDWIEKVGISERRGVQEGFRNGADSDNYYVNLHTAMPSCLIEMGFMNSDEDNENFDKHLEEYADAIAGGTIELLSDKMMYPVGMTMPVTSSQPVTETTTTVTTEP